jgi:hypothetical protein
MQGYRFNSAWRWSNRRLTFVPEAIIITAMLWRILVARTRNANDNNNDNDEA